MIFMRVRSDENSYRDRIGVEGNVYRYSTIPCRHESPHHLNLVLEVGEDFVVVLDSDHDENNNELSPVMVRCYDVRIEIL